MPTMQQIDDANAANAAIWREHKAAVAAAKASMTAAPEPVPETDERKRINEIKDAMRARLDVNERAAAPASRRSTDGGLIASAVSRVLARNPGWGRK
ncbi:MAG: hypothetical protein IT385_02710 [Deltaproteobacteria bacterium]|nr:hypothetical protein [Deltaproteobacteria bacterium]